MKTNDEQSTPEWVRNPAWIHETSAIAEINRRERIDTLYANPARKQYGRVTIAAAIILFGILCYLLA